MISTFFSGDATSMYNSWYAGQSGNGFAGGALVGPGLMFDTNRFYVVFLDGLGLWGASKPSDGLARRFPNFSFRLALSEPDLLPLKLDAAWIAQMQQELPELPGPRMQRFMKDYGLSEEDSLLLTGTPALADYFEECAKVSGNPRSSANWIMGDLAYALKGSGKNIRTCP